MYASQMSVVSGSTGMPWAGAPAFGAPSISNPGGAIDSSASIYVELPLPKTNPAHSTLLPMASSIFAMSPSGSAPAGGAGSGGSSPLGGAGGSGGGDGGGKKPMKRLTAQDVHYTLHCLKMSHVPSLLPEEFNSLIHKGLIERLGPEDYEIQWRSIQRLDLVRKDLMASEREYTKIDRERFDLWNRHGDGWHRFWSVVFHFGWSGLDAEYAKLETLKMERKEKQKEVEAFRADLDRLKDRKKFLDSFVKTEFGYLRMTDYGARLFEILQELKEYREGLTLEQFESRINQFRAAEAAKE